MLATVRLSRADTSDDLKQLIEGRIEALANVHGMFVEAELHSMVRQELSPYCGETERRARIEGPAVMLEPIAAQTTAITLHELATTRQNTDRYRKRVVTLKSNGPIQQTDGFACAGSNRVGRPSWRPLTVASAHALWKT